MPQIHPFLWFDDQAEAAANHYVSIFPNSKILSLHRYGPGAPLPEGTVMTVDFDLDGARVTALNGGPHFSFSEAVSFVIDCADQDEVDHYWNALCEGGAPSQCGWLKDRFGLSWQVVPTELPALLGGPDPVKAQKAMQAMLQMSKLDIGALKAARDS